jgi:D-alanyl-lipoteichoic acid acyltransferase DltB (MBOAT superfamily)
MLFNSLDYLAFLALTVAGFWAIRRFGPERDEPTPVAPTGEHEGAEAPYRPAPKAVWRTRGAWLRLLFLFLASCVFYMAWNPAYIVLILFSTVLDYVAGRQIHASSDEERRKAWLGLSLAGNLGLLGVFKYFNFFGEATADVLGLLGIYVHAPVLDVLLPVGISFYTFQTLSYTIDVYRRRIEPCRAIVEFAFYVTFFPQLVAGPIVRAAEFLPQLERPPWLTRERVGRGLFLIAMGLLKKIIFADFISVNLVDGVFDDPDRFSSTEVLLALYGFTLQIYADFSGYTDVARGSGMLFGLELPENFDRPYQATSVPEFWRRWHMTLSTWLRDYLYFPLGGSRRGPLRTYVNLWLTLFLIGLWHGASWTFVIYGNVQALAVVGTRVWERYRERRGWTAPSPAWLTVVKIFLTLQFVVFSRILFRSTSLENAWHIVERLFSGTFSTAQITDDVWRVLVLGFYLHYVPRSQLEWVRARFLGLPAWAQGVVLAAVGIVLALFVTQEAVPFIYFQF